MVGKRIILSTYLSLIYIALVIVFISENPIFIISTTIIFYMLAYIISRYILTLLSKLQLTPPTSFTGKDKLIVFAISSILCFAVMMIWFTGFRPGSFQGDCISQLTQAMTGKYNDWHPAWQTILVFSIPLKLTCGKLWAIVFFQMIWFSLAIGYMCTVIYEYAGRWWTVIAFVYIVLNPFTGQMMLYPWKDSIFSIAGLIAMIMICRIVSTNGAWADKPSHILLLAVIIANVSIFRRNGILFSVPLLLIMSIPLTFKQWSRIIIAFIVSLILIKGPLYNIMNVKTTFPTALQSVGLPMTIIGNVAKETPELMDPTIAEFVYSIAPQETWDSVYELGNFGKIRYYASINEQPFEDAGVLNISKMALKCFVISPKASFKALFALTDIVYGVDLNDDGYIGAQIEHNDLGLIYQGNPTVASLLTTYYKLFRLHGYNFLRQSAFSILFLLSLGLAKFDSFSINALKGIAYILPVYTYSFGTMLLLTSPDSRFFFITYLICPVYCVIVLLTHNQIYGKTPTIRESTI